MAAFDIRVVEPSEFLAIILILFFIYSVSNANSISVSSTKFSLYEAWEITHVALNVCH